MRPDDKTCPMDITAPLTALPDAEERRKISERARKNLADAQLLIEQLERFEIQMATMRQSLPEASQYAAPLNFS
jgi:hypothetical protein